MAKAKAAAVTVPPAHDASLLGVALEAIEPIRLDGEDFLPGDILTALVGNEADALLASGAARLFEAE